jgi:hypothetical protein
MALAGVTRTTMTMPTLIALTEWLLYSNRCL